MAKMDEFREEREAMKHAPLKERIAYFWEYNKLETFLVVFGVICIVSITTTILNRKEEVLSGMVLNRFWLEAEGLACEEFVESYLSYREYDSEEYDLLLNGSLTYIAGDEEGAIEENVNSSQVIAAQLTAGALDFMIADDDAILDFDTSEYFWDLRNIFTEEELKEYEERFIYSTRDESIPVAIDVTDSQCLSEIYAVQHETLGIALFGNAPHEEEFKYFVEYIIEN